MTFVTKNICLWEYAYYETYHVSDSRGEVDISWFESQTSYDTGKDMGIEGLKNLYALNKASQFLHENYYDHNASVLNLENLMYIIRREKLPIILKDVSEWGVSKTRPIAITQEKKDMRGRTNTFFQPKISLYGNICLEIPKEVCVGYYKSVRELHIHPSWIDVSATLLSWSVRVPFTFKVVDKETENKKEEVRVLDSKKVDYEVVCPMLEAIKIFLGAIEAEDNIRFEVSFPQLAKKSKKHRKNVWRKCTCYFKDGVLYWNNTVTSKENSNIKNKEFAQAPSWLLVSILYTDAKVTKVYN